MPVTAPPSLPPYFHVLAKPTGSACNLNCAYCFFLAKEALYPDSRFRMTDELLENYVRQYIEAQSGDRVTIAWQGGEPTLMGLDFFKRSVEYARKYARPGMQIEYTIQTNGTLLNDEWCAFFRENNFLVGLSIDGPQQLHD
ncbi:MAG: radical SAM protein, partial [Anaerolineales bacterium]|nr:radical SAM protein [Anaerolineales bacterium]